jgi:hypothetical protein
LLVIFICYLPVQEWFIATLELMRDRSELQRRLDADPDLKNISMLSADPGAMGGTSLAKRGLLWVLFLARILLPPLQDVIMYFVPEGFFRSPRRSGGDVLWACFDGGEGGVGRYPKGVFLDDRRQVERSEESRDMEKQRAL